MRDLSYVERERYVGIRAAIFELRQKYWTPENWLELRLTKYIAGGVFRLGHKLFSMIQNGDGVWERQVLVPAPSNLNRVYIIYMAISQCRRLFGIPTPSLLRRPTCSANTHSWSRMTASHVASIPSLLPSQQSTRLGRTTTMTPLAPPVCKPLRTVSATLAMVAWQRGLVSALSTSSLCGIRNIISLTYVSSWVTTTLRSSKHTSAPSLTGSMQGSVPPPLVRTRLVMIPTRRRCSTLRFSVGKVKSKL